MKKQEIEVYRVDIDFKTHVGSSVGQRGVSYLNYRDINSLALRYMKLKKECDVKFGGYYKIEIRKEYGKLVAKLYEHRSILFMDEYELKDTLFEIGGNNIVFGKEGIVTEGTLAKIIGDSEREDYITVRLSSDTVIEAHKDWYIEYKEN